MKPALALLIIDDNPGSLELLSSALAQPDLEILTASDPEQGLDLVSSRHPQIVLTDLVMPGMTGLEVLERVMEMDPSTDVILMTAHYSSETAVEAIKHAIRDELYGVFAFVGLVWCVFIVGRVLPFRLESFGVTPRTFVGLIGIPAAPFLHANLGHLLANTIPLTVLLLLLAGSKAESWAIVIYIVLLGGALLWMFGRPATHIGASGLIVGLIAFLLLSGIWERRIIPLIVSLVVGVLYGGTLVSSILPNSNLYVSWDGHLFGAIAGVVVAYVLTKNRDSAEAPLTSG
jgi:membrane associated rhomboid family serine protease